MRQVLLGDLQLRRETEEQGQRAVLKLIATLAQEKEEFQVGATPRRTFGYGAGQVDKASHQSGP